MHRVTLQPHVPNIFNKPPICNETFTLFYLIFLTIIISLNGQTPIT